MLVAWGALSTSLLAQSPRRNAIGFGFAATLGPGWQIEGGDIAYIHRRSGGLLGAMSIGARLGTFIDEGAILGGSRGIVFVASSSPLPQGSHWAAVALLPGLRAGSGDGVRYGLVIGPTAFFANGKSTVRGLLGLRIEAPLARRERRP